MDTEKKYIYRIAVGIILWFLNNKFTWEIVNFFANINNNLNVVLISIFRTLLILTSLLGLIIVLINSVLLFIRTKVK